MAVNQKQIAVIGAGPVGLAAATNLLERGLEVLLFEAGVSACASVRDWGHVFVYTLVLPDRSGGTAST